MSNKAISNADFVRLNDVFASVVDTACEYTKLATGADLREEEDFSDFCDAVHAKLRQLVEEPSDEH